MTSIGPHIDSARSKLIGPLLKEKPPCLDQARQRRITGVNDRAAGTVRVTAACLFTNHIIAPALPSLLTTNPHLRVELVADGRDISLTNREADVAIRLAPPETESRSIIKRVGQLSYGVYTSGAHANARMPWIAYDDRLSDLPQAQWIAEMMARDDAEKPQVLINDAETLLRCVKLGLGKSVLPTMVGDKEPDLVRIERDAPPMSRQIWLMVHPELRELTRIRAVMDGWRSCPPAFDPARRLLPSILRDGVAEMRLRALREPVASTWQQSRVNTRHGEDRDLSRDPGRSGGPLHRPANRRHRATHRRLEHVRPQ